MNQDAVLSVVVGGVVLWQVKDFFVSRSKERAFQQAQEYINKNYDEKISELKEAVKDSKNRTDHIIEDRAITKQLLIQSISELKNAFDLMRSEIMGLIKDHEKRLDVLEKKVLN